MKPYQAARKPVMLFTLLLSVAAAGTNGPDPRIPGPGTPDPRIPRAGSATGTTVLRPGSTIPSPRTTLGVAYREGHGFWHESA